MMTTTKPAVLVVDDDAESRAALYRCLDEAGYPAATLACGAPALQFVAERKPGLVILTAPEGSAAGARALGKIKSIAPDLPVLVLRRRGSSPGYYRILCEPDGTAEGAGHWMGPRGVADRALRILARNACAV